MTVLNAYAAQDTSHERRYVFNLIYMALNLGIVIGTLTVGYYMLVEFVTFLRSPDYVIYYYY